MSTEAKEKAAPASGGYKRALYNVQVELVKLQRHLIKNDLRILILLEGRDAAGKDGVIKRITAHLSPRDTQVVALGKPSITTATAGISSDTLPGCPPARKWSS